MDDWVGTLPKTGFDFLSSVDDDAVACLHLSDLLGHAVMRGVGLDRELQLVRIGKRGEGEGPLFLAPAVAVEREVGRLAGREFVAVRTLKGELVDVVRDRSNALQRE